VLNIFDLMENDQINPLQRALWGDGTENR
jgi:hypothetical protein